LKDDVLLFDYNVEERVNDFVSAALAQVRPGWLLNLFLLFDSRFFIFTALLHIRRTRM